MRDLVEKKLEYLAQDVFMTESRWPHYKVLLQDVSELSLEYKTVLSLERSILGHCGKADGPSRWEGVFEDLCVVNHGISDDRARYHLQIPEEAKREKYDLIFVPNLLHHVKDEERFLEEVCSLASEHNCPLYIFDTPFRELHDIPGHYQMRTLYGMEAALHRNSMHPLKTRHRVNSWEALHYMLDLFDTEYDDIPNISPQERMRILSKAKMDTPEHTGLKNRAFSMCWSVLAVHVSWLTSDETSWSPSATSGEASPYLQ